MKYLIIAALLFAGCAKQAEIVTVNTTPVKVTVSRSVWGYYPSGYYARFYFTLSNSNLASKVYMHTKGAQNNADLQLVDTEQYIQFNSLCDICFTTVYQVETELKDGRKFTSDDIIVTK